MRNFKSSNPFILGLKPRRFFSARIALNKRNAIQSAGGKSYNPNWRNELAA